MIPQLEIRILLVTLGLFFLTALLTGVWKYRHMMTASNHQAPYYVDIAHRSALQYSFAVTMLLVLMPYCIWSSSVKSACVLVLVLLFGSAIATYIRLGFANRTDNQYKERNLTTTVGMYVLIVGEIIAFLLLFAGVLAGF